MHAIMAGWTQAFSDGEDEMQAHYLDGKAIYEMYGYFF